MRKIILIFALCVFAAALVLVGHRLLVARNAARVLFEAADDVDADKQPWVKCAIPLPGNHGPILFLRRSIHPFLAEYDRQICFGDDPEAGPIRRLPINCGGRTCINVRWYKSSETEGPYVKLTDHWGVYIVDLRRKMLCVMRELDGVPYIGDLAATSDGGGGSGWSGSKADGETEWEFTVDGNPGRKATGLLVDSRGVYIGRIDGRSGPVAFISVDEAPEEKIDVIE